MPIQNYLFGVMKAVIPPLIPFIARVFAHLRITQPEDNAIVTIGKILVSGTYRSECGLSFVLLHHRDTQYWPQAGPVFDRTRRTWEKDVHINRPGTEKHSISIAAYTVDVRPLLDHYYHTGKSTGRWEPITLYKLPTMLRLRLRRCGGETAVSGAPPENGFGSDRDRDSLKSSQSPKKN